MTYSRPVSDAMMLDTSPATQQLHSAVENAANDNNSASGAAGGWTSPVIERTDHQNGDEEAHEPVRQLTDSPTSNGASHASAGGNPPVCQNCGTSTTPLWRRNELGATLCNACGLFLKLHGRARPLNLKTDTIKSRNRVKSVTQPKKKLVYDDKMHSSPRSGQKHHMNGHSNGYGGHMRIEQHPKHRPDLIRPPFDHHDMYSQSGYSYARSTASSNESGPDYSPPTGTLSEPPKPYSPYYGAVNSPRDYPRGAHTPPYYSQPVHHSLSSGPPPLSLPPPTSHAEGGRALPPAASLLRQSPPPRHDSPQLPPLYKVEASRHHYPPHSRPRTPIIPTLRESPDHHGGVPHGEIDHLRQSNEHLRGRVMELELVNDLMKSRVSELETAEQRARSQIDNLRSEISQYQLRENELYRKIDRLKDELVDTYKIHTHSRSPSNASRADFGDMEESASKRRKVLLSEIVDEEGQLSSVQQTPTASASPPTLTASPPPPAVTPNGNGDSQA